MLFSFKFENQKEIVIKNEKVVHFEVLWSSEVLIIRQSTGY